jgi:hypothetical protein
MFAGDTLVIPTQYWGLFLGPEGGPFRWICEEAINPKQSRQWAMATEGSAGAGVPTTYHVTDYHGITSSRDGGCTWISSTGELAKRSTSGVAIDPADPARAMATTDDGDAPWNALFVTGDRGLSWQPTVQVDEALRGLAVSPDGRDVYVTGWPRSPGAAIPDAGGADAGDPDAGIAPVLRPVLHVSHDGGAHFQDFPVEWRLDGLLPIRLVPLAVDPGRPSALYVRVDAEPNTVLLHVTIDAVAGADALTVTELLRTPGTAQKPGIGVLGFDAAHDRVYIPTSAGLYLRTGPASPVKLPAPSRAQCVVPRGDALYACAWNYGPDNAAIARSDDGGQTFRRIFQYADTQGPVSDCPADSPVAKTCPVVWSMYAAQLGIDAPAPGSDGGIVSPPSAGGCRVGAAHRSRKGWAGLLALTMVGGLLRRRRMPGAAGAAHARDFAARPGRE